GERNQFIVYSDAIKALPDDLFYQVVPEDQITSALTPKVYSRSGARIQGPYDVKSGESADTLSVLPPDSAQIYNVSLPDGKEMLFYCTAPAKQEEAPSEEETVPAVQEETPAQEAQSTPSQEHEISEMQHRLNEIFHAKGSPDKETEKANVQAEPENAKPARKNPKGNKPEANDAPAFEPDGAIHKIKELNGQLQVSAQLLKEESRSSHPGQMDMHNISGTKLYKPAMERRLAQTARNTLAEAVDQARVSRFESRGEAPGAVINDTTRMAPVLNPLDQFRIALRRVWLLQETHRQVAEQILATSGMRQMLSRAVTSGTNDLTIRAINSQLQELEAERLMTLMQLDDVKGNRKKLLETALAEAFSGKNKQLTQLDAQIKDRKAQAEALKDAEKQLCAEISKRKEEMEQANYQAVLAKEVGEDVPVQELIQRLHDSLNKAGFLCTQDDAAALLLTLALAETDGVMGICADTVPDAKSAVKAAAAAFGAPFAEISAAASPTSPVRVLPGGDSAAFTFDASLTPVRERGLTHIIGMEADDTTLGRLKDELLIDYTNHPWPVWWIKTNQAVMPMEPEKATPVSIPALKASLLKPFDGSMDESAGKLIEKTRSILKDAGAPLPLETVKNMSIFIASAKDLMKGGIAMAMDDCYLAYVVPHVRFSGVDPAVLLELTVSMPKTYLELSKA
ncbi:MAG: hypothetical protein IJ174_09595, partial [Clostridia bacterium]|nr:hypothetical protein [Clostridia bacterium]